MLLKIISAENVLFTGEVASVTLPGAQGLFTVLPRHASIVSTLSRGKISYRVDISKEDMGNGVEPVSSVEVAGGIVDVDNDVVSVCIY